jgi:ABC-type glutathione transport system ATPase component
MGEKILSVKNLTVSLKSDKSLILKDVSFDLYAGDVLAIDGSNGSGKTTLLRIIFGQTADYIIEPGGTIVYHPYSDKNILDFNEKEISKYRASIGYVPQRDSYDGINKITIEDLIDDAISDSNFGKEDAVKLFHKYFENNKRITLKGIPGKMSGGEQRMVSIFLGLVCRNATRLMVIDEPLNNLDFENVMKVSDLINNIHLTNKESAMIMITHCKVITCVNRQRKLLNGELEAVDSKYECHHCMGEPDCNNFYLK